MLSFQKFKILTCEQLTKSKLCHDLTLKIAQVLNLDNCDNITEKNIRFERRIVLFVNVI